MTRSPRGTAGAVRREELYRQDIHRGSHAACPRRTPALLPVGWLVPRKRDGSERGQFERGGAECLRGRTSTGCDWPAA